MPIATPASTSVGRLAARLAVAVLAAQMAVIVPGARAAESVERYGNYSVALHQREQLVIARITPAGSDASLGTSLVGLMNQEAYDKLIYDEDALSKFLMDDAYALDLLTTRLLDAGIVAYAQSAGLVDMYTLGPIYLGVVPGTGS